MSKDKKEIDKEKLKALEVTIGKLEKDYGKGTIMKLGDRAVENIQVISTGSIGLDAALGIGGLPVAVLSKFMVLKLREKQHWQFTP